MRYKAIALVIAMITGTMAMVGCGTKGNNTTDTQSETKQQTVKKEEKETMKEIEPTVTDKTDGDVYYKKPIDYKTKKTEVTYGDIVTVQYDSTTVGKKRDVTIVLPPNYTADKKYPVLYLLHGLGQDNTQWVTEGKAEIVIGNLISSGDAKEMILVLPNCRARKNDAANPSDAFTLPHYKAFDNFKNELEKDLMPFINSNYSAATGRENTAIAGFSMGGREALYIGISMQDTFGYVAGFCPAPGILAYSMNGVSEEGLFTKENFKLQDKYADNTLLMIVAGKSDTVVGTWPKSYHEALESNGVNHVWYKVSGGHDFNVTGNGLYNFAKELFK
jgi:enterochelin esterase-like enzyme